MLQVDFVDIAMDACAPHHYKEKLWRHLLGYERAGIFCDGERVVVPRLLSHVEDAWDKGFQPARHLAKCVTVESKVK